MSEAKPIMTWDEVDAIIRKVMEACPGWWPFEVRWREMGGYAVKMTRGPGTAWVEFAAAVTIDEALEWIHEMEPKQTR